MSRCTRCHTSVPLGIYSYPKCGNPIADPLGANDKKASLTASVFGIRSILIARLIPLVAGILSVIGLVLGGRAYKCTGRATGLILPFIGMICAVIASVI